MFIDMLLPSPQNVHYRVTACRIECPPGADVHQFYESEVRAVERKALAYGQRVVYNARNVHVAKVVARNLFYGSYSGGGCAVCLYIVFVIVYERKPG